MNNELIDFLIQLAATGVGVFAGLVAALWQEHRSKKQDEKATRNNTLEAIFEELNDMKQGAIKYLKNPIKWNDSIKNFEGILPRIETPAYQSSLGSGNFNLLEPPLQIQLGETYVILKRLNEYTLQIMNFHTSSVFLTDHYGQREANRICNTINHDVKRLLIKLEQVLPRLKDAKQI